MEHGTDRERPDPDLTGGHDAETEHLRANLHRDHLKEVRSRHMHVLFEAGRLPESLAGSGDALQVLEQAVHALNGQAMMEDRRLELPFHGVETSEVDVRTISHEDWTELRIEIPAMGFLRSLPMPSGVEIETTWRGRTLGVRW